MSDIVYVATCAMVVGCFLILALFFAWLAWLNVRYPVITKTGEPIWQWSKTTVTTREEPEE